MDRPARRQWLSPMRCRDRATAGITDQGQAFCFVIRLQPRDRLVAGCDRGFGEPLVGPGRRSAAAKLGFPDELTGPRQIRDVAAWMAQRQLKAQGSPWGRVERWPTRRGPGEAIAFNVDSERPIDVSPGTQPGGQREGVRRNRLRLPAVAAGQVFRQGLATLEFRRAAGAEQRQRERQASCVSEPGHPAHRTAGRETPRNAASVRARCHRSVGAPG